MHAEFRTDKGKIRHHNEDNGGVFKNESGSPIVVVADGMGGHRGGDVASRMAVQLLSEAWQKTKAFADVSEVTNWLQKTFAFVNNKIVDYAKEEADLKGMGTTLVTAVFTHNQVIVANVGDSRGYLLQNNRLLQVTEDHSLVNELLRKGEITEKDALHHPRKNILLRALGIEGEIETDIFTFPFQSGDTLLLCSDGLTNMVPETEIEKIMKSNRTLAEKADLFIVKANTNGGEDNITALLLERDQKRQGGKDPC